MSASLVWFRQDLRLQDNAALAAAGYNADGRCASSRHRLRWDVLVVLRYGGEQHVRISRSGFRQLLPVPESKAAWDKDCFSRLEDLLVASDASPAARDQALQQLIDHTAREGLGTPANQAEAIRRVLAWLSQYEPEISARDHRS